MIRARRARIVATLGPASRDPQKIVELARAGADLFRVTFDNQVTEWLIGFDAEDKIALLLFRPAES